MKSPLWIINSFFAIILITIILYTFFSSWKIPSTFPLTVSTPMKIEEESKKILDDSSIKLIYQDNDLFGTFIPKPILEEKRIDVKLPPTPPMPKFSPPLPIPSVSFMEPLKVIVTGIIMSTNESDNQVIISDNATKAQKLYRVGEKIYDAHILRIFPNKVIFIRANGQEETLFVTLAEAQAETKNMKNIDWNMLIQKVSNFEYLIDIQEIANHISNLAQFIDQLDLTTVFSKGIGIGTRIGKIHSNSIGYALGLMPGDIITSVNNILATKTSNRVNIYNMLRQVKTGDNIKVEVIRHHLRAHITYTVASIKSTANVSKLEASNLSIQNEQGQENEKERLMKEKYKFNNTVQDIKKRDKLAMMRHGSKKSILSTIPQVS